MAQMQMQMAQMQMQWRSDERVTEISTDDDRESVNDMKMMNVSTCI